VRWSQYLQNNSCKPQVLVVVFSHDDDQIDVKKEIKNTGKQKILRMHTNKP